MLLREYAIKRWFIIPPLLTNVSALPVETWTSEIVSFPSCCIPCLENDPALACYIFDTHHLSICRPSTFTAGSTKNSSVQPNFETATGTTSDEENVGRQRSRRSGAMSRFFALLGAYRRDRSASWLATLQWTLFRPRRRWSRQHVPRISEGAATTVLFRKTVYSMTEKTISGVHVSVGSADTLVWRGGIANHHLIACYQHLGNISAKITKISWCALKLQCATSVSFFETQCSVNLSTDTEASAEDPSNDKSHCLSVLNCLQSHIIILKRSFSQSISLNSHLSLAQADLLEFDHSVFGSHWRW